jgi:hypothetical protein
VDVVALPLEIWVRRHADVDEEIAGLAAALARTALSGNADGAAVLRALGDLDAHAFRLGDDSLSVARGTPLLADAAGAVARRARLLAAQRQRGGAAEDRVAERHLDLAAQVLPRLGPGLRPAAAAEEVPEEVAEVPGLEVDPLEGRPSGPPEGPSRTAAEAPETAPLGRPGVESGAGAGVAEPVVGAALLGVPEHLVGLLDLLEALLGGLVPGIDVRVELPGQTPVGLLDLGLRGPLRDAEDLVVVPLRHAGADYSDGRNSAIDTLG